MNQYIPILASLYQEISNFLLVLTQKMSVYIKKYTKNERYTVGDIISFLGLIGTCSIQNTLCKIAIPAGLPSDKKKMLPLLHCITKKNN